MAQAAHVSAGQAAASPPCSVNAGRAAGAVEGFEAAGRPRRAARLTRGAATTRIGRAWAMILANAEGERRKAGPRHIRRRQRRNGGETEGLAASGRGERVQRN